MFILVVLSKFSKMEKKGNYYQLDDELVETKSSTLTSQQQQQHQQALSSSPSTYQKNKDLPYFNQKETWVFPLP